MIYSDPWTMDSPHEFSIAENPDAFDAPQVDYEPEQTAFGEVLDTDIYAENPRRKMTLPVTRGREEAVHEYATVGMAGRYWYSMMYAEFLEIFQNDVDARMFIKFLAATSAQNDVRTNVIYAFKAFSLWKSGMPLPKSDPRLPQGTFQGFMTGHHGNLMNAVEGRPFSKRSPKVRNFADAMFGDVNAIVIDRWMIKALGFKVPYTGRGQMMLVDGTQIKGEMKPYRGGYLLKVDAVLQRSELYAELRERHGFTYVPEDLKKTVKLFAKSLNLSEYNALASLTIRLRDSYQDLFGLDLYPRDYQAAVWTGIKIKEDPVGLENFTYFYRKIFGNDPPNIEYMREYAAKPKYTIGLNPDEEEDPGPQDVPLGDPLTYAAQMLE